MPQITHTPNNILIQAPSWIGDLVMATASFTNIRQAFPDARISLLIKPGREKVLAGAAYFDELLTDTSKNGFNGFLKKAARLRKRRFDLVIFFSDSLRVATLAYFAGIPRRVGYRRNLRSLLLTKGLRYPGSRGVKTAEPMPTRYGRILDALNVPQTQHRPLLAITEDEEQRIRARRDALGISAGQALVGFNPGASFGSSKIWPAHHFARLGDLIMEKYGVQVVLLAGPGEESIAVAIQNAMKSKPISTVNSIIPLDELKPLVRDLRLLVTTDTGPRHYAVAFHVPVVVVMGATDPAYTNVNLDETEIIRREDVSCSPCHLKICPIDHRCMEWIEPEHVLDRIEKLDRKFGMFS